MESQAKISSDLFSPKTLHVTQLEVKNKVHKIKKNGNRRRKRTLANESTASADVDSSQILRLNTEVEVYLM
jgi:hypothetical protein